MFSKEISNDDLLFRKHHKGMFLAFATCFDCRRPTFWLERAVTQPAVLLAGHDLGADHLVGTA